MAYNSHVRSKSMIMCFRYCITVSCLLYLNRYACVMISFADPPLGMHLSDYMELVQLWTGCSPCVGFCISLGSTFFTEGVKEVDNDIIPELTAHASSVLQRVISTYSILYWFATKV